MKTLILVAALCGTVVTNSWSQCTGHKDNADAPKVRAVIDHLYGFFSAHELITQPLDRKDILVHTDPTISSSCPQHNKIMLSMEHLLFNAKMLGYVPQDAKDLSHLDDNKLMMVMHPVISHHYAHLQHNKFSLVTGIQQSPQEIEYHVDFIAGYLNGRSMWLSEHQQSKVFSLPEKEEQVDMLKSVFERDKSGMRATFKRVIKSMGEYQQVDLFVHNKKQTYRGLEVERRKAYINGFMSAMNYEIASWNRANDEKTAKWVEFFYEPLPEAKKRFARNLFEFLSEELSVVVDNNLMNETVAPTELMEKGDLFVSNLMTFPTLNVASDLEDQE